FAKAFGIAYTDKENKLATPHQTSWGMTTRLIGAVIMTHGDDSGLILPPAVAPKQVMVIPIAQHKEGVVDKATEVFERLKKQFRVGLDISEQSPGWKFSEYEMKGVPLRLELGPKDIENNQCVLVRRDTREKIFVSLDELETTVEKLLEDISKSMFQKALERREEMTYEVSNLDEMKETADNKPGFIKALWCMDRECEDKLKEVAGVSSRCMPLGQQDSVDGKCVCCGKPAKKLVYWGKAY
ncbi:MAG: proline--tRNA ligase, partial [Clostridia bacterium]|nr:proline--tRNA ligase [Clostridia bacterium]